jgi:hypothetical protein
VARRPDGAAGILADLVKRGIEARIARITATQTAELADMTNHVLAAVLARAGLDYGAADIRGWVADALGNSTASAESQPLTTHTTHARPGFRALATAAS